MDDKPVTLADLNKLKDDLVETMRDMQSEILRAFDSFASGQTIRLRKLEADHSNLDASASGRLEAVERRLFEIEKRLLLDPPKAS